MPKPVLKVRRLTSSKSSRRWLCNTLWRVSFLFFFLQNNILNHVFSFTVPVYDPSFHKTNSDLNEAILEYNQMSLPIVSYDKRNCFCCRNVPISTRNAMPVARSIVPPHPVLSYCKKPSGRQFFHLYYNRLAASAGDDLGLQGIRLIGRWVICLADLCFIDWFFWTAKVAAQLPVSMPLPNFYASIRRKKSGERKLGRLMENILLSVKAQRIFLIFF